MLNKYFDKIGIKDSDERILAIDIGHTNGIAYVDLNDHDIKLEEIRCVYDGKTIDYAELSWIIDKYDPTIIVFEDYILYGGDRGKAQIGSDLLVAKIAGALELLAYQNQIEIYKHSAVQHKKFGFAIMKKEGIELPKGKQHCYDALSLLIFWLTNNKKRFN